ncbi:MAG: Cyanophage [Bacteroidota bacterium]|jgi:hypothetical protein
MQIKGTFTQGTSSWSASQIHFSSGWGTAGYHATIGSGYTGTTAAGIMLGTPHIPWRGSYGAKLRYAADQAAGAYWDWGLNGESGGATDRFDLNRNNSNFLTFLNTGDMGLGTVSPASKLHVMGKINLHQSGGGGGQNRFEGLEATTSANGRGQFVMSSAYSDLVIASSQANDNHGSTLSFVTYNPNDPNDYRKFVINQGNWGARRGFLDFGFADAGGRSNPHANINGTDQVMSLDGFNKRVGIGGMMSPVQTLDVNGKTRIRRAGYTMANANEGQLELANAGNGECFITFHREGAYGAQFGLAADNWFSTYGWSAGGGYTPIRMGSAAVNGNLTVTGTATFGSVNVPWSQVSSKPAGWLDGPTLIQDNGNFNNSMPSGFYQANNAANSPTGGTWYNMINVRHSNTSNDHGFQLAMSYYDEYCYTRTYQGGNGNGGGSFTPWARHITNRPGDWDVASNNTATDYTAATIELRESNFGGSGATPPHLGFHWGGVVASNITIESDGTIAIRNNPGNGYEKFRCATIRTSGITETSDARLKKNVLPISSALATVLKLQGVRYQWKTNEELKSENITYQVNDDVNPNGEMGFIAQEVEKILPELVNTDKEGFKSMEYSKMVALLVEAYKDLHTEYQQLHGNFDKQQEQLNTVMQQLQVLIQQNNTGKGSAVVSTTTTVR